MTELIFFCQFHWSGDCACTDHLAYRALIMWLIMQCSRTYNALITWLRMYWSREYYTLIPWQIRHWSYDWSCTDQEAIMHWSRDYDALTTGLFIHWSLGYHALMSDCACTDHVTVCTDAPALLPAWCCTAKAGLVCWKKSGQSASTVHPYQQQGEVWDLTKSGRWRKNWKGRNFPSMWYSVISTQSV